LQYGAAVLRSLETRWLRTGNPVLYQPVEYKIIARELEELAEEWERNPPPAKTNKGGQKSTNA
jgi:hypothetical protein